MCVVRNDILRRYQGVWYYRDRSFDAIFYVDG